MKRNLIVALLLSVTLFSCRPKVVYVDRPVSTPSSYTPAPPANNDNQLYQAPPAGSGYVTPPANPPQTSYNGGQTQYDNGGQQMYNSGQNNNGGQQMYNNNNQNNYQESDQQYYANQQQVNYGSSSYQTFYDELSPYGSWVNYQSYGYAWVPAMGQGFTPYATNGQWVYTQYGMTWQSNYNWGWAPFHYGSWVLDPFYGWVWIPGNTWAPAHVVWGQYNGYYGWAPMGPGGYYAGYRPAANCWTFVPQGQVAQPNVGYYRVVNNNTVINNNITNVTIVNHDATYNNAVFNAGPQREELERATGHPMQVTNISETTKPVPANKALSNNNLSIYRPAVSQTTATHAAPAHIVPIENVKANNEIVQHGLITRQENAPKPATRPIAPTQTTPIPQNRQILSEPAQINDQPIHHEFQNPNAHPIEIQPKPTQNIEQPIHREEPNPSINQNERPKINETRPAQNNNQFKPSNQPKPQPKPKAQPQPKPAPRPASPERERK